MSEQREEYEVTVDRGKRCEVIDCPNDGAVWMVTEMAPGRPVVYMVCEKDAALIHLSEMPEEGDE